MSAIDDMLEAFEFLAQRTDVASDSHGNVSVVLSDRSGFVIKPSGISFKDILPMQLCGIRMDGTQFMGEAVPSVDTPHHLSIYNRHSDIGAICHTHSPYATAFAMVGYDIPVLSTEHADYFGHPIRCPWRDIPPAHPDTWGDHVAVSPGERAVLLHRHGALTFGKTAVEATKLAVALELIAQKTFIARQMNPIKQGLEVDQIATWHERYTNRYGQK